ncbi:MAG: HlyC/CorC family transporter [Clostridia bacterium]|nr:HlyC/CorC family transporter [Clostridia bacterium]
MDNPDPYPATVILHLLLTLFLLLLGALVRAAEEAIVICSDGELRRCADEGDRKAARILRLTEKADRFLTRLRTAAEFLSVATLCAALFLFVSDLWPAVCSWTEATWLRILLILLMALVALLLVLVLGVRLPRRLADHGREKAAYALLPFAEAAALLAAPFAAAEKGLTDLLLRLFRVDPDADTEVVTEEEIRMLVDAGEEKGVIEESQKEMINNIFEFDDIAAGDVMTHRTDIVAVDLNGTFDDVIRLAREEGYSRIPAYGDDIDDIKGVIYVKDLLPYVGSSLPEGGLASVMREAFFVPETKRCGELFTEMTERRIQMAIVSDEYGGTAGLVTLEDLLETIVGSIQDEYDEEEEDEIVENEDATFSVDGATAIDELAERLDAELPEGDYDTVGGMILSLLGRIPEEDEHPAVEAAGFRFTVETVSERRIERVRVERIEETQE